MKVVLTSFVFLVLFNSALAHTSASINGPFPTWAYPTLVAKWNIRSCIKDTKGTWWIRLHSGGFMAKKEEKWARFNRNTTSFSDDLVCGMTKDRDGNVWVAMDRYLINVTSNGWETANMRELSGDFDTKVSALFVDSNGIMWVKTAAKDWISYEDGNWTFCGKRRINTRGTISAVSKKK